MKRKDLIRQLEASGCLLVGHGGKHDWYHSLTTNMFRQVPQYAEINEYLAKRILKLLANP